MKLVGILLLLFSTSVSADVIKTGGAHPTVKVTAEGHGNSFESAKQSAFTHAIQLAVGEFIVSDQEANGPNLIKDFVGGYSAGYIDDYEILNQSQDGNEWVVKLIAEVASSKVAERMMLSGNKTLMINGEKIRDNLQSQLDQRASGDRLLAEVISSYPYNALIINSGRTEWAVNQYRQSYIDVPYEIHWSKFWLAALDEAFSVVAVNSSSCSGVYMIVFNSACDREAYVKISLKNDKDYFPHVNNYQFADYQTMTMITDEFKPAVGRPHIGLRVDLINAGGDVVDSRCARIDTSLFVSWYQSENDELHSTRIPRTMINGQTSVYGVVRVHEKDPNRFREAVKIKLTVEKTCI
jgi:hypothetical protein